MRVLCFMAAAMFLACCALIGCSDKIEPGNTVGEKMPAISVSSMAVAHSVQPIIYDAVGTVKARVSATVSATLMGVIQAIAVKEGNPVKKGDLLVVLDERQVAAQVNQARAALAEARKAESGAVSAQKAAEAGAEQALLAYKRNQTLLAGQAITRETFETSESQHKQAQASLSQAKAMVEAARYRINQAQAAVDAAMAAQKDTRILAPFDGKVTAKMADAGALAVPGTPLLALEREGGYRIDLVVPEAHIQSVSTGQPVDVRIPAIGDQPLPGSVDVIIPSGDPGSRTFVVQIGLTNGDALRSGMFARVALTVGQKRMMRVPESAVVRQGQLTGVFIVDRDDTARFRLIRTGRVYGDQVEVISGLRDGTRLVTAPTPKLSNGTPVEPEK